MAPRKQNREPATENTETAPRNPQPAAAGFAERLREEVAGLHAQVERMEKVQDLIRSTMKNGGGDHDAKINKLIAGLYELRLTDDEVNYVLEQKEGRDGNLYMGYTFIELNRAKNNARNKQLQLGHLEGKGGHVAAEERRREDQQGTALG